MWGDRDRYEYAFGACTRVGLFGDYTPIKIASSPEASKHIPTYYDRCGASVDLGWILWLCRFGRANQSSIDTSRIRCAKAIL